MYPNKIYRQQLSGEMCQEILWIGFVYNVTRNLGLQLRWYGRDTVVFIWLKIHQNELRFFIICNTCRIYEYCQQESIKYLIKPLLDTNSIMNHWSQAN